MLINIHLHLPSILLSKRIHNFVNLHMYTPSIHIHFIISICKVDSFQHIIITTIIITLYHVYSKFSNVVTFTDLKITFSTDTNFSINADLQELIRYTFLI